MNAQIQQLLDLPGKLNGMIKTGAVNSAVDQFDSNSGVRHYTSFIYKWAAWIGWVAMEFAILKAAYHYFTSGEASGLSLVGSVLTTLVLVASAFPIAQLIRARGESLGSGHQGMVGFIFGDFIKTNIRLLGEVAAIVGLFAAVNQTLAFLMDHTLFSATSAGALDILSSVASVPMNLLNELAGMFDMDMVTNILNSAASFKVDANGTYDGDFVWNTQDLFGVFGAYINVIVGLAFVYVNLAIYGFLYNLASTLIKWISSPSIPISVKNR